MKIFFTKSFCKTTEISKLTRFRNTENLVNPFLNMDVVKILSIIGC